MFWAKQNSQSPVHEDCLNHKKKILSHPVFNDKSIKTHHTIVSSGRYCIKKILTLLFIKYKLAHLFYSFEL